MKIEVRSISVRRTPSAGKLVALADVSLEWEDMAITIRSIRIEAIGSVGQSGTKICMPVDREGRAVVILPTELADAVAEVVMAEALDAGILKTR